MKVVQAVGNICSGAIVVFDDIAAAVDDAADIPTAVADIHANTGTSVGQT
jgi:hypothetical protein